MKSLPDMLANKLLKFTRFLESTTPRKKVDISDQQHSAVGGKMDQCTDFYSIPLELRQALQGNAGKFFEESPLILL